MYGGGGVIIGITDSPTSPNHVYTKHHYNYASNPQHFHHPNVLTTSSPIINQHNQHQHHLGQHRDEREVMNFPPPPPPLSSAISNMQATPSHSFRSNPKLTGNAIPRPYPGCPKVNINNSIGGGIGGLTAMKLTSTVNLSNNINNNSTNNNTSNVSNNVSRSTTTVTTAATSTTSGTAVGNGPSNNTLPTLNDKHAIMMDNFNQQKSTTNNLQQINKNLEACVQDLHDKTFGQGGVVQITSNNSYNQQHSGADQKNYEGYTSR